jgi:hypothetical protein
LKNFTSLCPLCGKRPVSPEVQGDTFIAQVKSACAVCRDHVFLGTNLVKKNRLAVTTTFADVHDPDNCLREPLFGRYQVLFAEGFLNILAKEGSLIKLWDISPPEDSLATPVTRKFINGYIPECREADLHDDRLKDLEEKPEVGAPKTLGQLAALALSHTDTPGKFQGLEALGILKADVDNLGLLMTCGLPEQKFTLSRLATLSRQLHFFFCLYLPRLLATRTEFQDTYTVFAGGDDLFLLGPWNRIIPLAREIRERFADFVAGNPQIHLSAGISLKKAHTPMEQLASSAEGALKQSKNAGRNRLTLFGETVPWEKVGELRDIKDTLYPMARGRVAHRGHALSAERLHPPGGCGTAPHRGRAHSPGRPGLPQVAGPPGLFHRQKCGPQPQKRGPGGGGRRGSSKLGKVARHPTAALSESPCGNCFIERRKKMTIQFWKNRDKREPNPEIFGMPRKISRKNWPTRDKPTKERRFGNSMMKSSAWIRMPKGSLRTSGRISWCA